MKILMVSMPSLHFFRWTEQLRDSGHEVFWFDITGMGGYTKKLSWLEQKTNWKLKCDYRGRSFIKNYFPRMYKLLQRINERDTSLVFEKYLQKIQPDVVHSFALYVSCVPILDVMQKYHSQKWIYSSWGSDLYYFQNNADYLRDIKMVLPRIDYLFTDCLRDFGIAKNHGFKGEFLGVFPGGGGFDLDLIESYKIPTGKRKIVLVKGFQGRSGRAINVLKAISNLKLEMRPFEIVIFGADPEVISYFNNSSLSDWHNIRVLGKITHNEVLKLMVKSLIYIGNSNSDGIPNTLLEAICSGAFPIQSNPGGATAEIIQHGKNGLLIEDCESEEEIINKIKNGLISVKILSPFSINLELIEKLNYSIVRKLVLQQYNQGLN